MSRIGLHHGAGRHRPPSRRGRLPAVVAAALLGAAAVASPGFAQDPPGRPVAADSASGGRDESADSAATDAADLERRVAEQKKQLEEMQRALESLNRRLEELEQAPDSTRGTLEERLKRLETSVETRPDLPPDVVSAGEFPGSMRVPGTDAALKVGGLVWTTFASTFDALGSDDRFLTYSIPVEGSPAAGKGPRRSMWAGPSRLNMDLRTPSAAGQMRIFLEGDFAASGEGFRLRHAYGQVGALLAGKTWSNFSDPDQEIWDLDFEGLNAKNIQRQTQLRFTFSRGESVRLAAAAEEPVSSVSGGKSVNQIPDITGRITWRLQDGHLASALVVREVRAEPDTLPDAVSRANALGLMASGTLRMPWQAERGHRAHFQVNAGWGIARYINDLKSAGGLDAAFDPATGELKAIGAWGFFVDYEHRWGSLGRLFGLPLSDASTSLIWGYAEVDPREFQPGDTYRRTHRLSANFVVMPASRMDLGVQFIYGTRENKDGSRGRARQAQVRARFVF